MRFVSRYIFLFVALLVTHTGSQLTSAPSEAPTPRGNECENKHNDIMENLRMAFGEANCMTVTYDYWEEGSMMSAMGLDCWLSSTSLKASASYQYRILDWNQPMILSANYNHTSGASTHLSSTSTNFGSSMGNGCLEDFDRSIFQRIQDLRKNENVGNEGQGPCQDKHMEVMEQLDSSFGEENCIRVESEQTTCNITLSGYTATAEYKYRVVSESDPTIPLSLEVVSTYTESDLLNSFAQYTDFSEVGDCLVDFLPVLDGTISGNRVERNCSNVPGTIFYTNPRTGKEKNTTCQKLGEGTTLKMRNLCIKYDAIAQACRGLCGTGQFCKCEDNPYEFRIRKKRNTTCTKVAAMENSTKTKKCQRYKFQRNCPSVCGCTESKFGPVDHFDTLIIS